MGRNLSNKPRWIPGKYLCGSSHYQAFPFADSLSLFMGVLTSFEVREKNQTWLLESWLCSIRLRLSRKAEDEQAFKLSQFRSLSFKWKNSISLSGISLKSWEKIESGITLCRRIWFCPDDPGPSPWFGKSSPIVCFQLLWRVFPAQVCSRIDCFSYATFSTTQKFASRIVFPTFLESRAL